MDKPNTPDAETLAKIYVDAVKAKHQGRAEFAKAAMAKVAAAEAASHEAALLMKFAEAIS